MEKYCSFDKRNTTLIVGLFDFVFGIYFLYHVLTDSFEYSTHDLFPITCSILAIVAGIFLINGVQVVSIQFIISSCFSFTFITGEPQICYVLDNCTNNTCYPNEFNNYSIIL